MFQIITFLILGFIMGGISVGALTYIWQHKLWSKKNLDELQKQIDLEVQKATAALQVQIQHKNEQIELFQSHELRLKETFQNLSNEALQSNNKNFLELAKLTLAQQSENSKSELDKKQTAFTNLIEPIKNSIELVNQKINEFDKARIGSFEALQQHLKTLTESQAQLRNETTHLVRALKSPHVRGRWGEIQLKRVVEMAGMIQYCDFLEQAVSEQSDSKLRPDLIVKLPGGKNIVVDAKAPLSAYLESIETTDDYLRIERLKKHAEQIRTHITQLSRKSYWDQFQPTPEFVILFLPGETFFSSALEQDPALIEAGVEQRVILATPTTLIALLRSVAYGWRQEALAENAREIQNVGMEFYKRIGDFTEHFSKIGKSLAQSSDHFNRAIGTFETRVLVSARKLKELEASGTMPEISPPSPIENKPRALQLNLPIE